MSILDPNWRYTPSFATDLRTTFAKAREELAKRNGMDERMGEGQNVAQTLPRKRTPDHGADQVLVFMGS